MRISYAFLMWLCLSPAAFAGEFQKLEEQPRPGPVACEVINTDITSLALYPASRGGRLRGCQIVLVGKTRFYLVTTERLIEEGSSPKRVLTYDFIMSQNETLNPVLVRSETLDVIDSAGDPSRRDLKGTVQLIWGRSSRDRRVMVTVAKHGPLVDETFILKLNDASDWLVNSFEELETK